MNRQILAVLTILIMISFSMAQFTDGPKALFHTLTGNSLEQGKLGLGRSRCGMRKEGCREEAAFPGGGRRFDGCRGGARC